MSKVNFFEHPRPEQPFDTFPVVEPGIFKTTIKLRPIDDLEQMAAVGLVEEMMARYVTGDFMFKLPDGTLEYRKKPVLLTIDNDGGYAQVSERFFNLAAKLERMQGIRRSANDEYKGDGICTEELAAIAAKFPNAWGNIIDAYFQVMRRRDDLQKKDSGIQLEPSAQGSSSGDSAPSN